MRSINLLFNDYFYRPKRVIFGKVLFDCVTVLDELPDLDFVNGFLLLLDSDDILQGIQDIRLGIHLIRVQVGFLKYVEHRGLEIFPFDLNHMFVKY